MIIDQIFVIWVFVILVSAGHIMIMLFFWVNITTDHNGNTDIEK